MARPLSKRRCKMRLRSAARDPSKQERTRWVEERARWKKSPQTACSLTPPTVHTKFDKLYDWITFRSQSRFLTSVPPDPAVDCALSPLGFFIVQPRAFKRFN